MWKMQSLLDTVAAESAIGKQYRTSRIMMIADLTGKQPASAVNELISQWFGQLPQSERYSGLCVVLTNEDAPNDALVHVLEASTSSLLQFIKRIRTHESTPQSLFAQTRICSFVEDVPREFDFWTFRSAPSPSEIPVPPPDALRNVFGMLQQLLDLAREASAFQDPDRSRELLCSNTKRVLSAFPSIPLIHTFSAYEDLSSPADFLQIFDAPLDYTQESELVSPPEQFIKV